MKKAFLLLCVLFLSSNLFAQQGISFQGIARDPQGNAIVNKDIKVTFHIGTSFTEEKTVKTDEFGVFSHTIGSVNQTGFNSLVFANISSNLKVEVDGTTIYDDKFNTVPYAKAAENGVPPGSIMPFAGPANKIPAGWLLCDGSSKAKTGIYQKLYEAIGTLWGDDGGYFKVPDLRGMFLRGINNGKTGNNADQDGERSVGSTQDDAFESHKHTGNTTNIDNHVHNTGDFKYLLKNNDYTSEGTDNKGTNELDILSGREMTPAGAHNHDLNIGLTGNLETRPKNAAVAYIIKY